MIMGEVNEYVNEMEKLEHNIISKYNELLRTLLEEGDMDTLAKVIMDDDYRKKVLSIHNSKLEEYM